MGDINSGLASLNPHLHQVVLPLAPQSGYPVVHYTEQRPVVPLPDGRTIPVTMQGGGGGVTSPPTSPSTAEDRMLVPCESRGSRGSEGIPLQI